MYIYLSGIVLIVAGISYTYFDLSIALFFYEQTGFIKTVFSKYITKLGQSEWILLLSFIVYLFYRIKKPSWAWKSLFIFASIACSGILVNLLKVVFARYRPKAFFTDGSFGFDLFSFKVGYLYNSFPSGHAVTAMGLAVALVILFPRYKIVFLSLGMLVAASRVIVHAHYLSDVLVGGLVGGLVSAILYTKYFEKKVKLFYA